MLHELPELSFEYGALEPHIDARTMEIHHTKHHAGYVKKLNALLECCGELADRPVEELLLDISVVPEACRQGLRNNGGGHVNHSLFWKLLAPPHDEPAGEVCDAICSTFGDLANFRLKFTECALDRFGSGWAWLCANGRGKLELLSTPNQDSPIMQGLTPILGLDVWEHAYYLNYQNRRADYIGAWWHVVNWAYAGEIYHERLAHVGSASA
jgi:Fe-Mn family superoxide dismutase